MPDNLSPLADQARQTIDERVRRASDARLARRARTTGRHRLAGQLRSVADRLDA